MKTRLVYILVLLLVLLQSACYTTNEVVRYDYSYLYDDNQAIINPKYKIFHHSEDSSILYYQLNSGDILYERIAGDSAKAASIKMKYSLYADRDLTILIDSGSQRLANYGENGRKKLLQNSFTFKLQEGKLGWLSVRFRDDNKDFNVINILKIDKTGNLNEQYFIYLKGEQVLFDQRSISDTLTIRKSNLVNDKQFVMEVSDKEFNMTPPPFAQALSYELKFRRDNQYPFFFKDNNYLFTANHRFNRFYPVNDSNKKNYIFYFGEQFPKLNQVTELINPTRYISTSTEYKNLKAAVNPKKGLDSFWLKLGKNENNSKELLKEYYERIEVANQFFTSYKEGWKTDRGIIYVIYGAPSTIRKNADKEVWLYGEENNVLSVQFRFYQPESVNISNHFEMVRNSDYKNNWYRQVDLWRQGKID